MGIDLLFQFAEERKEKAYEKKWSIRNANRASLTLFAIELMCHG
jgi:hypothetical protein